jgi:hypothetical protein
LGDRDILVQIAEDTAVNKAILSRVEVATTGLSARVDALELIHVKETTLIKHWKWILITIVNGLILFKDDIIRWITMK